MALVSARIAFGPDGASATFGGLAGNVGAPGQPGSARRARAMAPGLIGAGAGAREGNLAALARLIATVQARRAVLRRALRAATRRHERATLAAALAGLPLLRLVAWPWLTALYRRAHGAGQQRREAEAELQRCAVALEADLGPEACASFAALAQAFERLAGARLRDVTAALASGRLGALERARAAPVRLARAAAEPIACREPALRFAVPRGCELYLCPGLALLRQPGGGLAPIDPGALSFTARPLRDGAGPAVLLWRAPSGAEGAYLAEDGAAALAFGEAFAAYRQALERLATHEGGAGAALAAGASPPAAAPIAVLPPFTPPRLRLFPLADLAMLVAAVGLALALRASPSGLPAWPERARLAVERLAASVAGLLGGGAGQVRPEASGLPASASAPAVAVGLGGATVLAEVANLRAEPGMSAAIVGQARQGERWVVVGRREPWVQVRSGARSGWIHGALLGLVPEKPAP